MNGQVRYNNSVYDILGNVFLGGHQYLIIGDGTENKFIDIAFIEKRIEEEKVRYVLPNINYYWNKETMDFQFIKGQRLMDYVINKIKDEINGGTLGARDETLRYISDTINILNSNLDIKNSFEHFDSYENEEQFEASIKSLIGYYELGIKKEESSITVNSQEFIQDESVEQAYNDYQDELGKTQNFGVSLFNSINSYMNSDYANDINLEKTTQEKVAIEEEQGAKKELPVREVSEEPTSLEDIKYLLETRGESMPLQQKLYWESKKNELLDKSTPSNDLIGVNKGRAKTLSNGKSLLSDKAAYISISALLYIVGSFELLLSIILLAKYL